jgi:hypothetical protein
MDPMADESKPPNGPNGPDDEYPLLPPDPETATPKPAFYAPDPSKILEAEQPPEEEPEGFQFSLAELLGVMTAAAVFLGIVTSLPAGGSLQVGVGLAGIAVLVSLIVLDYLRPKRRILYIVWWTMFVSYLLVGLLAVVTSF